MHLDEPAPSEEERSKPFTWAVLTGMAVTFLLWGLLLFFVIGDKGPPEWDFSIVPDIPGESVYSTHTPLRPHGFAPGPLPVPLAPQHVMEPAPGSRKTEDTLSR